MACGLLPELNYTSVTVFSSFSNCCLSLLSRCSKHFPAQFGRPACASEREQHRQSQRASVVLFWACIHTSGCSCHFIFIWLSLWCLRAVNQESMGDRIKNIHQQGHSPLKCQKLLALYVIPGNPICCICGEGKVKLSLSGVLKSNANIQNLGKYAWRQDRWHAYLFITYPLGRRAKNDPIHANKVHRAIIKCVYH